MASHRKNPWNRFVSEYYANHKGEKPHKTFGELAVLYKTKKHEKQSHQSHKGKHSSQHESHQKKAHKSALYVVSIESSCDHCDPDTPEVFTQEPICELEVTESDPIVRYMLNGTDYCALGSNLLQYFNTELVVDSVGMVTRHGGVTMPVGRKRGPIEPYSKLEFSKEDYKWIKSRVKLPRKRRGRRA